MSSALAAADASSRAWPIEAGPPRRRREQFEPGRCEACWRSRVDRSRIYWIDNAHFHKLAASASAREEPRRRHDLRGEFEILRRCQGIAGIPEAVALEDRGTFLILILKRLPGVPLCRAEVGWLALARVLARLLRIVWRMARRGVSHNDLRPENILLSPSGEVQLVDFDQASTGSFSRCLVRSVLGLRLGDDGISHGIGAVLRARIKTHLPPRLIMLLRGRRNRHALRRAERIPALPEDAGHELRLLHAAWQIAARSNASSPGLEIPYYDLTFQNLRLPGERPWAGRWQCLRHITPYAGKRILELGCNLGLLSIFLLKEEGARAALAVDGDPEILDAARLAAQAFAVEPHFRCVNFDRDADWEDRLAAFRPDLVFALSVVEWLHDQTRFLTFLGRFAEVVFEGHHSSAFESRRLRAAGFDDVQLVGTSERGRPILLCRRA